jgi:hypothetical protein
MMGNEAGERAEVVGAGVGDVESRLDHPPGSRCGTCQVTQYDERPLRGLRVVALPEGHLEEVGRTVGAAGAGQEVLFGL